MTGRGRKPLVYRWRDELAEADDLTLMERATGWRCSDYADADGTGIRPGSLRLARDLGLTTAADATQNRPVMRALTALVNHGWLAKESNGYRGHAAEYRLTFPSLKGAPPVTQYSGKGDRAVLKRVTPQVPHQPMTSNSRFRLDQNGAVSCTTPRP